MDTAAGQVPTVSHRLAPGDRWGGIKARWGIGRMHYRVEPGLYALGRPGPEAVVLVTANYKLSFDALRSALFGLDAWILVLDTQGINVWCAAGKGSFSTDELAARIASSGLEKIVSHRKVLLPQLGAPGVAVHEVKKKSGFKALFGPIRAADLIPFLQSGWKATPAMRNKTFTLRERIVVIPVELVTAVKYSALALPFFLILNGLLDSNGFFGGAIRGIPLIAAALSGAVLAGTVLTPVLLPWLPGRAFSLKGALAGALVFLIFLVYYLPEMGILPRRLELAAWFFIITAVSAFLGMNFTGASTYTSLSGVKKEMKWAVPLEIGAGILGLLLWIGAKWTA